MSVAVDAMLPSAVPVSSQVAAASGAPRAGGRSSKAYS